MKVAIVSPVFDDWQSFRQLVQNVDAALCDVANEVVILAVDDGSIGSFDLDSITGLEVVSEIMVVRLVTNMGHQRAIAIGLSAARELSGVNHVVVMDSDGEDRPEDLPELLAAASEESIVVAKRLRRSEGPTFRIFYSIYKLFFRLLTGLNIDFGNFSVVPIGYLERLTHQPDLWNHLAAGLIRSRLPITRVAVGRGHRYFGRSHMNLVSLIVHGLSAVSVFSDSAFVRLMLGSFALAGATLFGAAAILVVRLSTTWAPPGWASIVLISLAVIFLQSLVLSVGAVFLHLNGRSTPSVIPAKVAADFIGDKISLKVSG